MHFSTQHGIDSSDRFPFTLGTVVAERAATFTLPRDGLFNSLLGGENIATPSALTLTVHLSTYCTYTANRLILGSGQSTIVFSTS